MKSIHIFKAGKHTALDGRVIEFSEADLKAAAEAYDPAIYAAPLVVGHPKITDAAYGEVESISFSNGDVDAVPRNVEPAFAELVRDRRFPNRSASWYLPDSPNNPKPGVLYLRHVGFLGAAPPALKGLRSVEFAQDEIGVIEFADWSDVRTAGMFRSLRDWILARFGQDDADKALPPYDVTGAQVDALTQPDVNGNQPLTYSEEEQRMNQQLKDAQDKLESGRKALEKREAEFAEQERTRAAAARRNEAAEFADNLVKGAKLPKEKRDGLVEFMCGYPDAGVVEFGEGDKKVSTPGIAWFKSLFEGANPAVSFGEVGRGDGVDAALAEDPVALATAGADFVETERNAGRTVSIAAAIEHVKKNGTKKAA